MQRLNARETISTALCTSPPTIELATRLAKILARKLNLAVYCGCSVVLTDVSLDEEIEALTKMVKEIETACLSLKNSK